MRKKKRRKDRERKKEKNRRKGRTKSEREKSRDNEERRMFHVFVNVYTRICRNFCHFLRISHCIK